MQRGSVAVTGGGTIAALDSMGTMLRAEVSDAPKVNGHKPSVGFLFESCVRAVGDGCIGVVANCYPFASASEKQGHGPPALAESENQETLVVKKSQSNPRLLELQRAKTQECEK